MIIIGGNVFVLLRPTEIMKSITLNQLSVISKTNYFTFLGVFKHVDEEFVCSCVFLCLQPFCLEMMYFELS